jgi:acyl-CoA synthetase (AMP-forming)/AMP-acid ligase II
MSAPTAVRPVTDNVSRLLRERAAEHPEREAVRGSDGRSVTFGQLERRVDAIAHGLAAQGLAPGDRALLFVRPGPELIAITHALFRARVVPVLIDPGMGRRSLLSCVERVAPRALIGIPRAQIARLLFPRAFASVEQRVTVGPLGIGGPTLARLEARGGRAGPFELEPDDADREAALLFTSGSTGPPKGVIYTHRNFLAQVEGLRALYDLAPGEVDVACFPLFALFDNALGMTSVFPELDPSRPGSCDPGKVFRAIEESGATFTFGSPAVWVRVADWARRSGRRFGTLRRLTIAGAPVQPRLVAALRELLPPGADVHTPYGATESLPVTSIAGAELAGDLRARIEGGEGTCVGRPVPGVELALIRITDDELPRFTEDLRAPAGQPGEVCVRGAVVTPAYANDELATRHAKMRDADGGLWHRMGDVGVLDADGRLWLHGRKSHRLETRAGLLMPVPLENVYNTVEGVRRTALVGVGARGDERPVLVVEAEEGAQRDALVLRLRAHRTDLAATQRVAEIRFHPRLPTDVRHNAKIRREDLKRWAQGRTR